MTQIKSRWQTSVPPDKQKFSEHLSPQKKQTFEYLKSLIGELAIMARRERANMLAYTLDMATEEIVDILSGTRALDRPIPASRPRTQCAISAPRAHKDNGPPKTG